MLNGDLWVSSRCLPLIGRVNTNITDNNYTHYERRLFTLVMVRFLDVCLFCSGDMSINYSLELIYLCLNTALLPLVDTHTSKILGKQLKGICKI